MLCFKGMRRLVVVLFQRGQFNVNLVTEVFDNVGSWFLSKGAIQCQWLVTEVFDNVGSWCLSKGAIQCQWLVTEVFENVGSCFVSKGGNSMSMVGD